MEWANRFADSYERLPGWARLLFFPVVAPLILAYGIVVLPVFFLVVLPYLLVFGSKQIRNPAANFTLAEVREHAESLNRWFADTVTEDPDCLGVSPELAKQLANMAGQTDATPEQAALFAERVGRELKFYKGTPFFALRHLSQRLAELVKNERAA